MTYGLDKWQTPYYIYKVQNPAYRGSAFFLLLNMNVKGVIKFLQVDIWRMSSEGMPPLKHFSLEVLKKILLAIRFFTAKRVMNDATALTYSTLLAIVPILAVVFAVARGFGYNKYIEIWFRDALRSQPQAADVIVGFVNSYLIHTKSGVFLGFGLLFMLYTVLMLVTNIERTFNEIWQVKKERSIFRTFTDYFAMLFLVPIVLVVTSGISIFLATLTGSLPDLFLLTPTIGFLLDISPYVLMSSLFIGLYVFMPNTHVKVKSCIVPGIMAGVAMQWLQLVYIHSQMWVSSYNAIYGSFAALPLFMLWVQISWTICLFGAELCYTSQNLDYYDFNTTTSAISHRFQIVIYTMLMGHICRRFEDGRTPYTINELRDKTGIPLRVVNDLMYKLVDAGLLAEISSDEKGESSRFIPAISTEQLSLGIMIDRIESLGRWQLDWNRSNLDESVWSKAISVRSSYLKQSKNLLLRDFCKE